MSRFLIIMMLLSICASMWSGAEFTPEVREYDFGNIYERDGKVVYDFVFENTGDAPLILIDVHAG